MESIVTDHPLNASQLNTLKTVVGKMLPASAEYGVPGADDESIFGEIRAAVTREHEILGAGLDVLTDRADSDLEDLQAVEIQALVEQAQEEVPGFTASLVMAAVECYYRDPRVMAALGKEPRPPFPQGYEVPDGDWSMLEPVRARGPIWREAT